MSLPPFLQNVPNKIIKKIKAEDAWKYRIIPYNLSNDFSPSRLVVALEQKLSSQGAIDLRGRIREATGIIIVPGESLSPNEMDEALDRYYP